MIKKLDFFGSVVGLKYNGNFRFRSKFGGIMGIITLSFSVIIITFFLHEYFSFKNYRVLNEIEKSFDPGKINLHHEGYYFAIGILNKEKMIDDIEQYFTIESRIKRRNDLGEFSYENIPKVKCDKNSFGLTEQSSFLQRLDFGHYFCFNLTNAIIEGSHLSSNYSFLETNLYFCQNDEKCKDKDEILAFLDENDITSNFYYVENYFTPKKERKTFRDLAYYELTITSGDYKKIMIELTQDFYSEIRDFLFGNNFNNHTALSAHLFEQISVRKQNSDLILNYKVALSKTKNRYTQYYSTFSEIIGNMFAIINFFYLITNLIVYLINNRIFQVLLVRELFDLKKTQEKEDEKNKEYNEVNKINDIHKISHQLNKEYFAHQIERINKDMIL